MLCYKHLFPVHRCIDAFADYQGLVLCFGTADLKIQGLCSTGRGCCKCLGCCHIFSILLVSFSGGFVHQCTLQCVRCAFCESIVFDRIPYRLARITVILSGSRLDSCCCCDSGHSHCLSCIIQIFVLCDDHSIRIADLFINNKRFTHEISAFNWDLDVNASIGLIRKDL